MVYCCVPFCTNDQSKTKGISYHEFPSNSVTRENWLKVIDRQGQDKHSKWAPTDYSVVCSAHFQESDYKVGAKRRILLKDSVPSIFPKYPQYKQPKIVHNRRRVIHSSKTKPDSQKRILTRDIGISNDFSKNEETTANSILNEELMSHSSTAVGCQTDFVTEQINNLQKNLKKQQNRITYFKRIYKKLKIKASLFKCTIIKLNKKLKDAENPLSISLKSVHEDALKGDLLANLLLTQLQAYNKKRPQVWPEILIRHFVIWRYKSPKGYEYARRTGILKLPSRTTLKRYIGSTTGEVGVTSLVAARLTKEAKQHTPIACISSLIIDEMSIRASATYVKHLDCFLGFVDMAEMENDTLRTECDVENVDSDVGNADSGDIGNTVKLADKLLCFILRGISTHFKVPVAYFFTRQLTAQQLKNLTFNVITKVENLGFPILRIVTDNLKVNAAFFKQLLGGSSCPEIKHPVDASRPLYLSYDYCHVVKNVYSQFLSRDFLINGNHISSRYVKHLYEMQKNSIVKPVRYLTSKHVYPSNLEKMNVQRAVQLFAPPVTAALETLRLYGHDHFQQVQATVEFMKVIHTWFKIHDVSNRSAYISMADEDRRHFESENDDRINWLTLEFPMYLEKIQKFCYHGCLAGFTKETEDAIMFTTMSMAMCIKYLLKIGFHYVLTRSFSSDDIESFFGSIRQLEGSNDQMDAVSVVSAIEKILHTGIISPPVHSNVKNEAIINIGQQSTAPKPQSKSSAMVDFPEYITGILSELSFKGNPSLSTTSATLAYIGGYLVRVVEERSTCNDCIQSLAYMDTGAPIFALVRFQNRGKLLFPHPKFIKVLQVLTSFIQEASECFVNSKSKNIVTQLKTIIMPHLMKCPIFSCNNGHTSDLCELILDKFLPPILKNIARNCTDEEKKNILTRNHFQEKF